MLVKVRARCRPGVNGKQKNISVQATCSDLREGLSLHHKKCSIIGIISRVKQLMLKG